MAALVLQYQAIIILACVLKLKEKVMTKMAATIREKIDPSHAAILVIDMQNDFCSANGAASRRGIDIEAARALVPAIQRFVAKARKKRVKVVFIGTVRDEKDISPPMRELWARRGWSAPVCVKGTWGAEFVPELRVTAGDLSIIKTRYSAFVNTELDTRLRQAKVSTVIVTGVATNVCVASTCGDAFMHDYYVVIPEDLVTGDKKLHTASLDNLNSYYAEVTTSDRLLGIWDSG